MKAFFISFISLTLSFASCTLVILGYLIDIFTKSGSTLSAKDSSLLISITQVLANLVLLNILERINRRVSVSLIFLCMSYHFISVSYVIPSDTLHRVISVDNGKFFLVRCLRITMDRRSTLRMDADILFGVHHLFQLVWLNSHTVHSDN